VTTHQLVYYAPPKSAIVGMVGAILGTPRSDTDEPYSEEYKELLSSIRVGIGILNGSNARPQKVLFGTNRRPLNYTGHMKPTKSELVENPNYRIYVTGADGKLDELRRRIDEHDPAYPVYFGHAYCQARVEDARIGDASIVEEKQAQVCSTVIIDSREEIEYEPIDDSQVIVENKLISNVRDDGKIEIRSLPHMIPLFGTKIEAEWASEQASEWQDFMRWKPDKTVGDAEVFSVF